MLDYLVSGVPISRLSTQEIESLLENGWEDDVDRPGYYHVDDKAFEERLRLELAIRQLGLRK